MSPANSLTITKIEDKFYLFHHQEPVTSPNQCVLCYKNPLILEEIRKQGLDGEFYQLMSLFCDITQYDLKPSLKLSECMFKDPFFISLRIHPQTEWALRFPEFIDAFHEQDLEAVIVSDWSDFHWKWIKNLVHELSVLEKSFLFHIHKKTTHIFLPILFLHNIISLERLGQYLVLSRPGPILNLETIKKFVREELQPWQPSLKFLDLMLDLAETNNSRRS